MEYRKKVTFSFCKGLNAEGKFTLDKEDYDTAKNVIDGGKRIFNWINEDKTRVKNTKAAVKEIVNVGAHVGLTALILVVEIVLLLIYLPSESMGLRMLATIFLCAIALAVAIPYIVFAKRKSKRK
jgi:hypothetical protein